MESDGINVLSLFDGVSCGLLALDRAGISVDRYFSSEIDGKSISVSKRNHGDRVTQIGDVNNVDWDRLPDIDLLIGGSPCQGFSFIGKQLNFSDPRSALFFKFSEALTAVKPKFFLLENVKMKREYSDVITDELGVEPELINSDRFVQQNRERLYWFNWNLKPLPIRPNWSGQYYSWRSDVGFRPNKSGVCPCLLGSGGGRRTPYSAPDLGAVLPIERLEQLQGLPVGYTEGVSKTARVGAIGNGWQVDTVAHILSSIQLD